VKSKSFERTKMSRLEFRIGVNVESCSGITKMIGEGVWNKTEGVPIKKGTDDGMKTAEAK